jgi:DNA-binding NarL/FixJ family response regulator
MGDVHPIRVILADDHQVVRRGIRDFLVEDGDIEVIAEAEDGAQALKLIEQYHPDVAVLDVQMPRQTGIEVARRVRAHNPTIGLLILTAYDDDPYLKAALEAGVNGYVLKTADAEDIVAAVHTIAEGKSVLDPGLANKLMNVVTAKPPEPEAPYTGLTARERDVLGEAARGLTNKAIGQTLGISDRTVQGHLRNIFEKLDVTNRTEAVVRAVRLGWLELPE